MLPAQDSNHLAEGLAWIIGQYQGKPNLTALLTAFLNRAQEAEDMLWEVIGSQLLTRTFPAGTAQGELDGPPDQALLQTADLIGAPVGPFSTRQLAFLIAVWLLARKSKGLSEDLLGILGAAFGTTPGFSGTHGILTAGGGTPHIMTLTGIPVSLPASLVGQTITISFSTTAANEGVFLITAATSGSITWVNGAGVNDASGTVVWGTTPSFAFFEAFPAGYQAWVTNVADESLIDPLAQALTIARPPGVAAVLAWGDEPTTTFFLGDPYGGTTGSGLGDPYGATGMTGLLQAEEV
jgi:hypothetical protein